MRRRFFGRGVSEAWVDDFTLRRDANEPCEECMIPEKKGGPPDLGGPPVGVI